jgi:Leucine-rich repeat (LRR) protein
LESFPFYVESLSGSTCLEHQTSPSHYLSSSIKQNKDSANDSKRPFLTGRMAPFSYGGLLVTFWVLIAISGTIGESNEASDCPVGCFCDSKASNAVPGGQGLKINCHPLKSTTGTFDVKLPKNTIQLDLAKYGLREIRQDTFAGLTYLEKLDLQGNKIAKIADGAFQGLKSLQVLDLTRNSLQSISRHTLSGLEALNRLKLADNNIQTIQEGSFNDLEAVVKVKQQIEKLS